MSALLQVPEFAFAFVAMLGVLITVHEFGHFLAAKLCGVRVLKFSIGFGPPIGFGRFRLAWQRSGTDYVIAWFPLGGFVRMLGDTNEDAIGDRTDEPDWAADPALASQTLGAKPLWQKLFIIGAGPAMNLLLPVVVIWGTLMAGVDRPTAVVGTVERGSPGGSGGHPTGRPHPRRRRRAGPLVGGGREGGARAPCGPRHPSRSRAPAPRRPSRSSSRSRPAPGSTSSATTSTSAGSASSTRARRRCSASRTRRRRRRAPGFARATASWPWRGTRSATGPPSRRRTRRRAREGRSRSASSGGRRTRARPSSSRRRPSAAPTRSARSPRSCSWPP